MTRVFGGLTLLSLCGLIGYAVEGNEIGMIVFAIFVLIFGVVWLGSTPPERT